MLIQLKDNEKDFWRLVTYLEEVNADFATPLSDKIPLADYARKLLCLANVWCVEEDGQPVALMAYYDNNRSTYEAYLSVLSTKAEYRGRGYGKLLVERMIKGCEAKGMKRIRCYSDNQIAVALYKSFGFAIVEYVNEEKTRALLELRLRKQDCRYLVTAIGSFSADCVIKTLRADRGYVVGCDIYPGNWHPETQECDVFYQAPLATDECRYVDFLLDIVGKEKITHLIPLTDLEIDVINRHRASFETCGAELCIPSESCLRLARNKAELCRCFKDDPIVNIPFTVRSEDLDAKTVMPFPLIAKPVNGRSSEGLYRLYAKEELVPYYRRKGYLIQEMLEGNVFTVDYVRDAAGHDFAVPREELLRTKNGAGTTVRVFMSEELNAMVSYIGRSIGVLGCVNMEFILNAGKYYLIDINPRFSAGVAFSRFVGYDMVASHIRSFNGADILPAVTYKEQIVAKRYREEQLWTAEA